MMPIARTTPSYDMASPQNDQFHTFVHALVESYNDIRARIHGLEDALMPHVVLDPHTHIYAIDRSKLMNYNTRVINTLMQEHSRSKHSIFTMMNANLKTIFGKVTKKKR